MFPHRPHNKEYKQHRKQYKTYVGDFIINGGARIRHNAEQVVKHGAPPTLHRGINKTVQYPVHFLISPNIFFIDSYVPLAFAVVALKSPLTCSYMPVMPGAYLFS
jgi:hypothetical protein